MSHHNASANAIAAATKRLKEAHWDEWETIYAEERTARGLPALRSDRTIGEENRMLRYRIQELEAKINGSITMDELRNLEAYESAP